MQAPKAVSLHILSKSTENMPRTHRAYAENEKMSATQGLCREWKNERDNPYDVKVSCTCQPASPGRGPEHQQLEASTNDQRREPEITKKERGDNEGESNLKMSDNTGRWARLACYSRASHRSLVQQQRHANGQVLQSRG